MYIIEPSLIETFLFSRLTAGRNKKYIHIVVAIDTCLEIVLRVHSSDNASQPERIYAMGNVGFRVKNKESCRRH